MGAREHHKVRNHLKCSPASSLSPARVGPRGGTGRQSRAARLLSVPSSLSLTALSSLPHSTVGQGSSKPGRQRNDLPWLGPRQSDNGFPGQGGQDGFPDLGGATASPTRAGVAPTTGTTADGRQPRSSWRRGRRRQGHARQRPATRRLPRAGARWLAADGVESGGRGRPNGGPQQRR